MGFFAGLNDEKYDRQYTDRELMRRIFEYFKPQTARRRVDHGFATRPMTPCTPMPPGQTRSQRPQPTQP